MIPKIEHSWNMVLQPFLSTTTFTTLIHFLDNEYNNKTIFPARDNVFRAFTDTHFNDISVVIIGQDPYHKPGQANGLAFSVPYGITIPPSLKNIYTEIESDLGTKKDFTNGNLSHWADQGVFLLNSVLTVEENKPGSHTNKGWEECTDYIIQKISDKKDTVVFLLWGKYAQKKGSFIDRSKHLVLETSHPSPLGAYRGFIRCKHFSQANIYLKENGKEEIKW
jgi:uracil-DNA glycosylase